jgi:hypothetical protein
VARGQFGKNFPPPVLDGTNRTTPLNDSKMRQVSLHVLTRLLHSGFIREKSEQNDGVAVLEEADEESLSANVASYRISCSGNLNEKNDT